MTLAEIRQKFIELSGRFDLIKPDGTDNGADFFINAGQRWLDRQLDTGKCEATYYKMLDEGDSPIIQIQQARAIKEVYVTLTDGKRWQLNKGTRQDTRAAKGLTIGAMDSGPPRMYYPSSLRQHHNSDTELAPLLLDDTVSDSDGVSGIVLIPRPGVDCLLEIVGLFYSRPLVNEDHQTFWSVVHPDLLILASLARIEAFFRNFTGVKDYMASLQSDVAGIDMDAVAQQIVDIDQMRG